MRFLISSSLAVAVLCGPVQAQVNAEAKPAKPTEKIEQTEPVVSVPFNGNKTCPISGKPVKQTAFAEKDQRRVYTCCGKCKKKVAADFDNLYAKAYPAEAVIELKNTICPISGEPADELDGSVIFQGHKINLCCDKCQKRFEKNPRRYLALLTNPELKALNNKKCIVSTDELVEPGSFFVFKNTLIDACCDDCADDFAAAPGSYLAKFKPQAAKVKPSGEKQGG